jgi:signal transduction histidine kinase
VIHDAVEQIRPQAEKKELVIRLNLDDEDSFVPGNAIRLQRAFVNIMTNAVNYTSSGGAVTISVAVQEPGQIQITIQDTGVGIEPSDLPHIFERFYRADKARSRSSGGSGLGLAITREILARHHGTISVESTFGKGSTFIVTLPLAETVGAARAEDQANK